MENKKLITLREGLNTFRDYNKLRIIEFKKTRLDVYTKEKLEEYDSMIEECEETILEIEKRLKESDQLETLISVDEYPLSVIILKDFKVERITDKALLVRMNTVSEKYWIPKSVVKIDVENNLLSVPDWFKFKNILLENED